MNYDSGFESGVGIGRMEGRDGTPCMSDNVKDYWEGKLPWKSLPKAFKAGVYAGYREGWAEAYKRQVALEADAFAALPLPPPVAYAYRHDNKPMPHGETKPAYCPACPSHIAPADHQAWLLTQGIVTPDNFHMPRPHYEEPRRPKQAQNEERPATREPFDFDKLRRP